MIYKSIDELVGKTPLFHAKNLQEKLNLKGTLLLKLESFNPAGSIKDRVALEMLNSAIKDGKLKEGGTIIEPTSGNTGIGLTAIAVPKGYKVILTMPDTMSIERIKLLKAYGAEVVLTDGKLGMKGALDKAEELNKTTPNSIIMGQFENSANPTAHYNTTAREIWEDSLGKLDILVAGIGTGGTISGTAKYLKEQNKDILVVGVEPFDSPLITKGVSGGHKLQGIGANFLPKNLDLSVIDKVLTAKDQDAFSCARLLAKTEGLLCGISSGASVSVAIELLKKEEYKDKCVVAILPDTGDRYLSTELFE